MEVLIFRTNVNCQNIVSQLGLLLNKHWAISGWNFDLEDCDKILRIEASSKISEEIIKILKDRGLNCEELPY